MRTFIKRILEKILSTFGYKLEANNFLEWTVEDSEFIEIFNLQSKFSWENEGPKIQRMYMIRNFILSISDIDGEWAECGVFKGSTSLMMAEYSNRYNLLKKDRKIHLFDSFEGLSEIGKHDLGTNMKKGDYLGTEDEVKKNLSKYDQFKFHKGWIPEKFNEVEDHNFSFVHIDVDLYQPIKDSLSFFFPRMVKGGLIVLDDYGCNQTPGAFLATEEIAKEFNVPIMRLKSGQACIRKT